MAKKRDELEEFCGKCAEQGLTYAEMQRKEFFEKQKEEREKLERIKERDRVLNEEIERIFGKNENIK